MNQSMNQKKMQQNSLQNPSNQLSNVGYLGQSWLVEERDACGVGFIANKDGQSSHDIVDKALSALVCLEHRGGCSADYDSGDGAGVMTAIPWDLLQEWVSSETDKTALAVGMVFLPPEAQKASIIRHVIERVLTEENLILIAWRKVPVEAGVLGIQARENQPKIEQLIVKSETLKGDDLERHLYRARRRIGKRLEIETSLKWPDDLYICSFSCRTIVYKGMVRSAVLAEFYTDLKNPEYKSNFAVYHRRFSTNTMPRWPLAQPMRLLGHNGEINTLLGNINWMMARKAELAHPVWGESIEDLKPSVDVRNSDSANLDNALELLVRSGRSPMESLMIMVPEAYKNQPDLEEHQEIVDRRAHV